MVDNIILDTLTNPTLETGNAPLISTKVGERDGTRGGGQPDGQLYDISRITYLGAFLNNTGGTITDSQNALGQPTDSGKSVSATSKTQIGFRPPNGTNGTYGSILSPIVAFQSFGAMELLELQIPENLSLSSDHNSLPVATTISGPVRLVDTTSAGYNPNSGVDTIGFSQEIDGRLFVSVFGSYDTDGNQYSMAVFDDPDDLINSTGTGWISTTGQDFCVAYASPIPAEYQGVLGGSWMMGSGNNYSILSRFSQGPSMWIFNPDQVANGDTTISTTVKLNYPSNVTQKTDLSYPEFLNDPSYMLFPNFYDGIDGYNEGVLKWYIEDQLGYTYNQGVYLDNTGWYENTGYLEYLASSPRIPFDTLEPPPPEVVNNLWNYFSSVCLAFIVPGTRTLFCVGTMGGIRYGGGYKVTYLDGLNTSGGQSPVDRDDLDHYYWLFDMDDIINATNTYDPRPYAYGIFDNNRWSKPTSVNTSNPSAEDRKAGRNIGGFFDQSTGRMYLSAWPYRIGFNNTSVISVYQIV